MEEVGVVPEEEQLDGSPISKIQMSLFAFGFCVRVDRRDIKVNLDGGRIILEKLLPIVENPANGWKEINELSELEDVEPKPEAQYPHACRACRPAECITVRFMLMGKRPLQPQKEGVARLIRYWLEKGIPYLMAHCDLPDGEFDRGDFLLDCRECERMGFVRAFPNEEERDIYLEDMECMSEIGRLQRILGTDECSLM